MLYHVANNAIIAGPFTERDPYVVRRTRCGTPEVLPLADYGLVPEIKPTLGEHQSYGEPVVSADAVTWPVVDWSAEQIAEAQAVAHEAYLDNLFCAKLGGKLALINAGLWDQYEAIIAAMLPAMSPAQRVFVEDAQTWRFRDPVLQVFAAAIDLPEAMKLTPEQVGLTEGQLIALIESARFL